MKYNRSTTEVQQKYNRNTTEIQLKGEIKLKSQKIAIKNPTGNLCREAMKFKSKVTFDYDGNIANAKSVLSVLGACIKSGDEITLICEGEDEEEALTYLIEYINNGLGE